MLQFDTFVLVIDIVYNDANFDDDGNDDDDDSIMHYLYKEF